MYESNFILRDTFDFVNKISNINKTKYYMISFDVESLFTNIPLKETIEIVIKRLYKDGKELYMGLSKVQFRKLLQTATMESHFQFRGCYFNQIDGVAMGSPLAPTLANIFMMDFEEKYMEEMKQKGVNLWLR